MPKIHETEVVNVKIYHIEEGPTVYAITSEDVGCVQCLEIVKKNFVGWSYT